MINCPKCGKPNYDTDKYCASCGFKLNKEPAKKLNRLCLVGFLLLMTSILMVISCLTTIIVFSEKLSSYDSVGSMILVWVMFFIPFVFIAGLIVSIIGIGISKKRGQSGRKLALGGILGTVGTIVAGLITFLIFGTVMMSSMIAVLLSRNTKDKKEDNDTNTTYSTTFNTGVDSDEFWATYTTEPPKPFADKPVITYGSGPEIIKIWSYSDDAARIAAQYIKQKPEFGEKYTVECTVLPAVGEYQDYLDRTLKASSKLGPDIYFVDADFAVKYTQGKMSKYAAAYKDLGIDVTAKIKEAEIAHYVVDVGTRDGKVVALSYQSSAGVMIYNAEIARDAFGTDDPAEIEKIFGAGTRKWDKFLEASETLKSRGYVTVSGYEDIWPLCDKQATEPWREYQEIYIAPSREEYLDLAKTIKKSGYSNDSVNWSESWYKDMKGEGYSKVFAYFGPAWLINYVMIGNCGGSSLGEGTYGQWRVCAPPAGFYLGGSWVLANADTEQKEGVAELIEWITLDTSDTGLQYLWANGLIDWDNNPYTTSVQDAVASSAVMARSEWSNDFCGGQNLFPAFVKGNMYSEAKAVTQYDEVVGQYYKEAVRKYAGTNMDRYQAIRNFKNEVWDNVYSN